VLSAEPREKGERSASMPLAGMRDWPALGLCGRKEGREAQWDGGQASAERRQQAKRNREEGENLFLFFF
jgi:hypothetical protein